MIKEHITVLEVIRILNEMVVSDPEAVRALIETRVSCNESLADHPSVQVQAAPDGSFQVGLLGVLNGLFGTDDEGWGPIAACFAVVCPEHGKIEGKGVAGDRCPERRCGRRLQLGELTHFKETKVSDGHPLV